LAAFRAIALLRSGESRCARTLPPFRPPRRPRSAANSFKDFSSLLTFQVYGRAVHLSMLDRICLTCLSAYAMLKRTRKGCGRVKSAVVVQMSATAEVTANPSQNGQSIREGRLLSVREVAQLLGMSTRWVHERTRRREIGRLDHGASQVQHRAESVDRGSVGYSRD